MKTRLAPIAFLAFTACSSYPVTEQKAAPVPAKRVLNPAYLIAMPGQGSVTLLRDSAPGGIFGAACVTKVSIDGTPVLRMSPGESSTIWLDPGPRTMLLEEDSICSGTIASVAITAAPGRSETYRIMKTANGVMQAARIK